MRVLAIALCALTALLLAGSAEAIFGTPRMPTLDGGVNGGSKCAVCTLVAGLVSQTMQLKTVTAEVAMDTICGYLPGSTVKDVCNLAVSLFGTQLASLLNSGETPDTACAAINFCTTDAGQPTCRLFPPKNGMSAADHADRAEVLRKQFAVPPLGKSDICKWLPEVCQVANHLPAIDFDNDTFATDNTLRGAYWRGKDCDDLDGSVFPGRDSSDTFGDSNCNGIFGVDNTTLQAYEDEWCKGTGAIGVAALGDSATAHFRLPPDYFNASMLSAATFANVLRLLEDEADWPMLSWSTGHLDANSFAPDISGPVSSVYSLLRERNLCNHRDYANLGVNGARVANLYDFAGLLHRNGSDASKPVKPLLLVMSMIGNDVCDHNHGFNTMTTPEEYAAAVTHALDRADSFLPAGSHVVLIPLVDGRILFDEMHNRIHPIGWTNKDVTYTDLYDFLNCLDISPCWGWMNSNETVRNTTWVHASALNAQLPTIASASAGKYNNIRVHYLGNIFDNALNSFPGQKWQLIEPVDGFHPSQLANALLGSFLFNAIDSAGILSPANPNNAAILNQFGNQGGY